VRRKAVDTNFLKLKRHNWHRDNGTPFELSYDCIQAMLDALPKDLRCDKNELIGEILGDVFMYRYRQAADTQRKQKTPTKRSSFWISFAAKLEPSASAISTILARIPAPKNLVAGWNEMDSPEFRDLDRVVDGKGFGSRGVRPSHWNARAELERTVEILR